MHFKTALKYLSKCTADHPFFLSLAPLSFQLSLECIKYYQRNYGDNFEHNIPENASLLEFSPRGSPSEAMPVVLWNWTDPETSNMGRGRLLRGGKLWVAERVKQADQGNYTVRDGRGKVLSRSTLTVHGKQRHQRIKVEVF